MKKILPFINAFLFLSFCAPAQKINLNAYGSYVLQGGYNSDYGYTDFLRGTTGDGLQWGAGIEHPLSQKYGVEIMYLRRNTHASQESELLPQKKINFNLNLNYMLGGINGYLQPDTKKLQAYGSMFAGLVIEEMDFPDNAISSAITKFAWAVRLGGKYWISDRVGVRLQMQWTSFFNIGSSIPVATNIYGLNTGDISFPIAYQFELGSGFIVRLWKNEKNRKDL